MATHPAPAEPAEAAPVKGRKKLILIAAAALLLAAAGGGGAFWFVHQKAGAAVEADAGDEAEPVAEPEPRKKGDKQLPVFLPLEVFTVNLADRDAERYAQVGVTLELADTKTSDLLKAYMPAVRNDVLMLIAHKKAADLQDRDGKLELAREIRRAALKPLDATVDADEPPVRAVLFSSFIIQ